MGREALCTASWRGEAGPGKALLENASILFRGEFRFNLPFREIKSVEAIEGQLRLTASNGTAVLYLGPDAGKWAHKILHPPTLLEKLGVKPGMSIHIEGVEDAAFRKALDDMGTFARGKTHDIIFFGVEASAALHRLRALRQSLNQDGAVWVVYPKGVRSIREGDVLAASKEAGLVDVKVASFSPTHTALKMVIPVSARRIPQRYQGKLPR